MNKAFINGFLKEAMTRGCTPGEAWDIYKSAFSSGGAFATPSFAPPQPVNPNPPIIDTVKPPSIFPTAGANPGASGGLGGAGSLGSGSAPGQNYGFNINQTGQGGVNNSVTSAPPSSVNSVLNKPVAAPAVGPSM